MRSSPTWDASGIVTEDGALHRPFGSSEIPLPSEIRVDDGRLIWRSGPGTKWTRPREGLLERFVDLAITENPDKAVAAYAKRWGVLEICEHGLPRTHKPGHPQTMPSDVSGTTKYEQPEMGCLPLRYGKAARQLFPEYWEPLLAWQNVSRRARAILNIAAHLRLGKHGALADWHVILGGNETLESWTTHGQFAKWDADDERGWGSRIRYERWELSRRLNDWLEIGDVRPEMVWEPAAGPTLRIALRGLFGAIAMELVKAVARTEALAICSGCGQSFIPKRKPVEGKRRYCEECRIDGVPMRDVMRDRRTEGKREVRRGKTTKR